MEHYIHFYHLGYLVRSKFFDLYKEAHTTSYFKTKCYAHATEFFFLSAIPAGHSSPSLTKFTRWSPAPLPYVTINTDGSSKGNLGMSDVGSMARFATSEWLWGFSLHLGITNNTMAKLWGIREALLQAWDNDHRQVCLQTNCLQTDSLLASKWLNTNGFTLWSSLT